MTIGQTLRKLRQEEGLTIQSLSIICGLSERYLNYIEHDRKNASIRSLTKISDSVSRNLKITYSQTCKNISVEFVHRELVRPKSFDDRIQSNEIQTRLYQDCLRLCQYNQEKAKDLQQETTIRALIFFYRFNESSQLYTWIFGIAKKIYSENNKKDRNLDFVEQYIEGVIEEEDVEVLKTNRNVYRYIQKLSPKRKQLYKLRLLNMKYTDIAEQMGLRPDYVKSRFWQIKGEIKKLIESK